MFLARMFLPPPPPPRARVPIPNQRARSLAIARPYPLGLGSPTFSPLVDDTSVGARWAKTSASALRYRLSVRFRCTDPVGRSLARASSPSRERETPSLDIARASRFVARAEVGDVGHRSVVRVAFSDVDVSSSGTRGGVFDRS